jgi:transcriptional regulator with XRE-family HTH domain
MELFSYNALFSFYFKQFILCVGIEISTKKTEAFMIMNLGVRLKALRKGKDMTQDEVAECLGVSYQAVSRWERGEGYPDISLLPLIAGFFSTTTDELLGVNQEKTRETINRYLTDAAENYNKKDTANGMVILRKALSEFPNSNEIMLALVKMLYLHSQLITTNQDITLNDEITRLCERILAYSLNDNIRAKTTDLFIGHYLYNIKDIKKAKEIAGTIPRFDYVRAFIPAQCVCDDKEKQTIFQEMIMNHAYVVSGAIRSYVESASDLCAEMKIDLLKRCGKMFEILFDAEYNYDILFAIHLTLAELYIKTGKHNEAIDKLLQCEEYATHWDNIKNLPHTQTFDTPLLNLLPKHVKAIDAFEKSEHRDIRFRGILVSELERLYDTFLPLHDNDRYKEMVGRLMEE